MEKRWLTNNNCLKGTLWLISGQYVVENSGCCLKEVYPLARPLNLHLFPSAQLNEVRFVDNNGSGRFSIAENDEPLNRLLAVEEGDCTYLGVPSSKGTQSGFDVRLRSST